MHTTRNEFLGDQYKQRFVLRDRCPVCLSVCNVGVLWSNSWIDQYATWYGGRPRPTRHCVRRGLSSLHGKEHSSPPQLFGPCLLWPNDRLSQLLNSCLVYDESVFVFVCPLLHLKKHHVQTSRIFLCRLPVAVVWSLTAMQYDVFPVLWMTLCLSKMGHMAHGVGNIDVGGVLKQVIGNMYRKFCKVLGITFLDMRADRQTCRHARCNTWHPYPGRSNKQKS